MNFSDYQKAADGTRQFKIGGPQSGIAPMLGVASVTGAILNVYKKYLRDDIDLTGHQQFLSDQLGDLLWYASAVATTFELDLQRIAESNLDRTRDKYGKRELKEHFGSLPVFDSGCPPHEQFPHRAVFEFTGYRRASGHMVATLKLCDAFPNPFPNGPTLVNDKHCGFRIGDPVGAPLTDNSHRVDAYRFHDAIHIAFMSILGWSPTMRRLLQLRRRSNALIDENEDGARAVYAEEGLSAVLSRLAERRNGFQKESNVDGDAIVVAQAATVGLEIERTPIWLWRRAISQGFIAMQKLGENNGGYLVGDLQARELTYQKVLS